MSSFQDHFSTQAETYAASRPTYPDALFTWLSELTADHSKVWDCATGNGQAANSLAVYYDNIIATDASEAQIKNAFQHPKINYKVATAENSGLPDQSIDLVTVATAMHWFDIPKFFAEVQRILKPGGVVAAWSYYDIIMAQEIMTVLNKLAFDILGPYRSQSLEIVANGYRDIEFPFEEIAAPQYDLDLMWTIEQLTAYIHSWSFTQKYKEVTGVDPLPLIEDELKAAWGDLSQPQKITWPLILKVGRKK